ncbi:hypothetical protein [Fredinandcohnia sp. 179-A 10B2 NHS]|uniref:hypothetical protein n=1 Tax=Fredinandcohnia sp. 179-A 10B2 NHS TaxID=3235176 RepID=UPI0039A1D2D0
MKTWLWIIGITILVIGSAALAFGAYKMFESTGGEHSKTVLEAKGKPSAKDKEKEFKEQTRKVNGITFDLKLDSSSSEYDVIVAMHKMTHQKV